MKLTLVSLSIAGTISLATVSDASAWTRNGTVTTWRGTYHGAASGGCYGGTCSRVRSITGPNGGTVARTGSVSRTGPDSFSYSRATTGPNGNSVTRSGSVSRY